MNVVERTVRWGHPGVHSEESHLMADVSAFGTRLAALHKGHFGASLLSLGLACGFLLTNSKLRPDC